MKQFLTILLMSVFCLGTVCCRAEALTEAEGGPAVLVFSSFDGGGPEYSITVGDPEIVTCSCRQEYDDPELIMPGAGYNVIYTITGLKPGTTKIMISMTSPLMEGFDAEYVVVVDDELNVTCTLDEEKAISRFRLYRYGEMAYDSYEIVTLMDRYSMSVNGDDFKSIDDEYVDELFQVIEKYDLYQWDGFDECNEDVLDGEGFLLEVSFTDGTSIRASGDNAFPPDYFSAIGEMNDILETLYDSLSGDWERTVGTDIAFEDITDFYYTYDASTAPPFYQRYRFYVDDGKRMFFHETREGGGWPQTEEDITASGTMELQEDEWASFCSCIEGGTVQKRTESLDDGDAGPWMFLYWNGDEGEYQEFSFETWGKQTEFERFCEALRDAM